jgi:hypothetical protein
LYLFALGADPEKKCEFIETRDGSLVTGRPD